MNLKNLDMPYVFLVVIFRVWYKHHCNIYRRYHIRKLLTSQSPAFGKDICLKYNDAMLDDKAYCEYRSVSLCVIGRKVVKHLQPLFQ